MVAVCIVPATTANIMITNLSKQPGVSVPMYKNTISNLVNSAATFSKEYSSYRDSA